MNTSVSNAAGDAVPRTLSEYSSKFAGVDVEAPSTETFRPYQPEQTMLLPPSVKEWLPAAQLVRFVREVAAEPDLRVLETA